MHVSIDRDRCVGAGQCVLAASSVFDQSDEDGRVLLRTEHPEPGDHALVEVAERLCPMDVISVRKTSDQPAVATP
jgi:ferredoxin